MAAFTSYDNSKRRLTAMAEILGVGFIASATVNLFTSAPWWVCVPICASASGWWYIKNLTVFRFALTENSKVLLTGPGGSQLEVSSGDLGGNTNPWKYRNEDAKADNQVSTGVQPILKLSVAVEGKDTGNRVKFEGQIAWRICNLENFNRRGSVAQATDSIISALTTDFKRFAGDEMKKGGQGLRLTEDVVLKEDESRDSFLQFINSPENVARNEQMGFEIVTSETLLEDVDYDDETKKARAAFMQKKREGEGEAARIDQILKVASEQGIDPRLALAADRASGDVSIHQTGFKIEVTGDPALVEAAAKMAGNPAAATALATVATAASRNRAKGKTDGTK
jgi:hypothetical protein